MNRQTCLNDLYRPSCHSFTPRRSLVRSQYRPPSSAAGSDRRTGLFAAHTTPEYSNVLAAEPLAELLARPAWLDRHTVPGGEDQAGFGLGIPGALAVGVLPHLAELERSDARSMRGKGASGVRRLLRRQVRAETFGRIETASNCTARRTSSQFRVGVGFMNVSTAARAAPAGGDVVSTGRRGPGRTMGAGRPGSWGRAGAGPIRSGNPQLPGGAHLAQSPETGASAQTLYSSCGVPCTSISSLEYSLFWKTPVKFCDVFSGHTHWPSRSELTRGRWR